MYDATQHQLLFTPKCSLEIISIGFQVPTNIYSSHLNLPFLYMVPAAVHSSPSLNLQKTPIFVGKSSVVICWLDHWQVNTCSPQHLSIIAYSFVPWRFRTNGGPANHSKIDDFQHGIPNGLMFLFGLRGCWFWVSPWIWKWILWYWYGGVSMISIFIVV